MLGLLFLSLNILPALKTLFISLLLGLDEATLIPDLGPESGGGQSLDSTYSFTTECFFMTHYCFKLGFCVLQERLMSLNQDLTHMQRLYQDVVGQDGGTSETGQQIKQEMEKGI